MFEVPSEATGLWQSLPLGIPGFKDLSLKKEGTCI